MRCEFDGYNANESKRDAERSNISVLRSICIEKEEQGDIGEDMIEI